MQLEGSPRLAGSSRGCRGSADSEFTRLPRLHLGPIWLCLGSIGAVWDLSAPSLVGSELVWFLSGLVCDLLGPCRGSTGSWDLSGSQPAVLQVDTFGSCLDAIPARVVRCCPVWARLFPEVRLFKSPLGLIRAPRVIKLDGLSFLSSDFCPKRGRVSSQERGAPGSPVRPSSFLAPPECAGPRREGLGDTVPPTPRGCGCASVRAASPWGRVWVNVSVSECLRVGVGGLFLCALCVSPSVCVTGLSGGGGGGGAVGG